jgi:hypothetical protein
MIVHLGVDGPNMKKMCLGSVGDARQNIHLNPVLGTYTLHNQTQSGIMRRVDLSKRETSLNSTDTTSTSKMPYLGEQVVNRLQVECNRQNAPNKGLRGIVQ